MIDCNDSGNNDHHDKSDNNSNGNNNNKIRKNVMVMIIIICMCEFVLIAALTLVFIDSSICPLSILARNGETLIRNCLSLLVRSSVEHTTWKK